MILVMASFSTIYIFTFLLIYNLNHKKLKTGSEGIDWRNTEQFALIKGLVTKIEARREKKY